METTLSGGGVKAAEFPDQFQSGAEFEPEIEWALHQNFDGFPASHGLLPPWEKCPILASPFNLIIGIFMAKVKRFLQDRLFLSVSGGWQIVAERSSVWE